MSDYIPGDRVHISADILEVHPQHPLGGTIATVCAPGVYLQPGEVPVWFKGNRDTKATIYYIPEQYVRKV